MLTHYIKTYPLGLLIALAIVALSLAPFPEIPAAEDIPLADKWTHMVMYGSLTLVIWIQYLRSHQKVHWIKLTIGGILAPAALGGLMELAQAYLTTYRSGDWLDFIANCIGVAIAVIPGLAIQRKFCSK
ncbi:MAG: VanZ family protein [Bacteroidaceae bacterium]